MSLDDLFFLGPSMMPLTLMMTFQQSDPPTYAQFFQYVTLRQQCNYHVISHISFDTKFHISLPFRWTTLLGTKRYDVSSTLFYYYQDHLYMYIDLPLIKLAWCTCIYAIATWLSRCCMTFNFLSSTHVAIYMYSAINYSALRRRENSIPCPSNTHSFVDTPIWFLNSKQLIVQRSCIHSRVRNERVR